MAAPRTPRGLTDTLAPVQRATGHKIGAIERAQAVGKVSDRLTARHLLDQISSLTLGNIAGDPNLWTDEAREALTQTVGLLTTPSATPGVPGTERGRRLLASGCTP
ncbi:hypothetical protein [Streptomyces sp. NPDC059513]|uniref:hypothetical protein n=1 Tax=unclassified Streptomyces TaxID=2593676 RepID=UPI003697C9BA